MSSSSDKEQLDAATTELASLNRVSLRLAHVDSSKLPQVLDKLVPRLIRRVRENGIQLQQAKSKELQEALQRNQDTLIQLLHHTLTRVRNEETCVLPCEALLDILLVYDMEERAEADTAGKQQLRIPQPDTAVDSLTRTLVLTFLTVGMPRCAHVERLVPGLLVLLGDSASLQQQSYNTKIAHLLLTCLQQIVNEKKQQSSESDSLSLARTILGSQLRVAQALYDLMLDVFLYQPSTTSSSTLVPPGLSQQGHERLKQSQAGTSSTTPTATSTSRTTFQQQSCSLALLEWLGPKWDLLGGWKAKGGTPNDMGVARTVALLVVASGVETTGVVAQRASTLLQQYMDSYQRGGTTTSTASSNSSSSSKRNVHDMFGNAPALLIALLSLCLGQSHAEAILSSTNDLPERLGLDAESLLVANSSGSEQEGHSISQQQLLSTKRRPVSQASIATIVSFCSKVLDERPQLFLLVDNSSIVSAIAELAVQVARKTLDELRSSSGLSTLRAKPYMAAAQLLNSLSIRLAVYYDSRSDDDDDRDDLNSMSLAHIMARSLTVACSVLDGVSTQQRPSTSSKHSFTASDGNIAVRDACYGVVCTFARSRRFALAKQGFLFARGRQDPSPSPSLGKEITETNHLVVSIETAKLLFGCSSNEEETLRPRAVAALDALLGAYHRVYAKPKSEPTKVWSTPDAAPTDNPWENVVSDAKQSVDAVDSLTVNRSGLSRSLLPLIWTAAQSYQAKSSRVAAARWASDLLKELELASACHLLCFLAGDSDVTAASIARDGLGLPKQGAEDVVPRTGLEDDSSLCLPDFGDLAELLFASSDLHSSTLRLQRFGDFSFHGKAAALRFTLMCFLDDIYGGDDTAVKMYLDALTETLALFLSGSSSARGRLAIDLLDESATCLLAVISSSLFVRKQMVRKDGAFVIRDIETLALTAESSRARRLLATSCGQLYCGPDLWEDDSTFDESSFQGWISNSGVDRVIEVCSEKLSSLEKSHVVVSQIHGSIFLGAHAVRAFRLQAVCRASDEGSEEVLWSHVNGIFRVLGSGLLHADETIGNACADGLAIALSYDGSDAPKLDERLYVGSSALLSQLAVAIKKYGNSDAADAPRATKLAKAAGVCLGATTSGSGVVTASSTGENVNLGPARLACVEAVFNLLGSMSSRKDDAVSLVAGEALASYADAYNPTDTSWNSPELEWEEGFGESLALTMPPHQHVLYVLLRKCLAASSPHTRTSTAPALLAIVAQATRGVHSDNSYSDRYLVKALLDHLDELQLAFITLLKDPKSKQLSRESCCLGLAACRGLTEASNIEGRLQSGCTSEELNQRLLRAFGQSTKYGTSAYMETQAQAAERRANERGDATGGSTLMEPFGVEGEVGGASGIGEAALGAYREMASATVALQRDDILYALLLLSTSHPLWFSEGIRDRYSASSLLGESSIVANRSNSIELRDVLRPHIGKLLPRILRACNDPNKQTREQMAALWIGLTGGGAESRLAITQHLISTIDTLIEEASSKLWRARVGACGALAEIIVGREWSDLGGGSPVLDDDDLYTSVREASAGVRLLRLWRTAMRALDDVRGAVRESGETLARAVRGLTIRLCDASMIEKTSGAKRGREEAARRKRDATAAAATSLRWLIRHGLNQQCSEATGIAISTLVEIVGVVSPKILEPIVPGLLRSLLMAMSGLEPAALSYLQLRTTDQEGLERVRLMLAQSGPLATAVTKCLDLLPSVSTTTAQSIVPELDTALRMSAGFATRAATADAVSTLCSTCPQAFKFSGPSSMNPSVRLLRALYFASDRERTQAAKDKMIHALGSLAALCPGASVRSLAVKACEKYTKSTGSSEDPTSRRAAAATIRAIAVRASHQFADGGSSDVYCRRVLPVAFIGMKDSIPAMRKLWAEVWEEGGSAARMSDTGESPSFGTTLEENLLPHLVHECVKALQDVSWSRRVAGSNALLELSDRGILSPAPTSTGGGPRTSVALARARNRAQASSVALQQCVALLTMPRLWTGKSAVLKTTVKLASKWASASVGDEIDEQLLLGWDGTSTCSWKPVTVIPSQFENDLFAGDGWFIVSHPAEETVFYDQADDDKAARMEIDEGKDDSPINFAECDTVLDDEEAINESDDDGDATRVLTFTGLCRLLIDHALSSRRTPNISDELLPYRAAAFLGFCDMLNSLPTRRESVSMKKDVYRHVREKLLAIIASSGEAASDKPPPVLVAGAVSCIGACFWEGMGSDDDKFDNANVVDLIKILKVTGGRREPAWTVREASALCMSKLAQVCNANVLRQPSLVSAMVECAADSLQVRKFWKVRYAGLDILRSLTLRTRNGGDQTSQQLTLEALLPHKEVILKLAKSSLSDSEAQVTALSSEIMSGWP